jgi:hypothetical protein
MQEAFYPVSALPLPWERSFMSGAIVAADQRAPPESFLTESSQSVHIEGKTE